MLKYIVFETELGFSGMIIADGMLLRVFLPASEIAIRREIQSVCPEVVESAPAFGRLSAMIQAYFAGERISFEKTAEKALTEYENAGLGHAPGLCKSSSNKVRTIARPPVRPLSRFQADILQACARIPYGQTVSYGELADLAGRPRGARAVGNALANNPLPIIVPCHRVIRSDGSAGGFTHNQPGATALKKRMLALEGIVLTKA